MATRLGYQKLDETRHLDAVGFKGLTVGSRKLDSNLRADLPLTTV
jgi:hypothetical protein